MTSIFGHPGPISILPKMGLVIERILFKQIYAFVHKKLSGKQFGFMGRRSVSTQLSHFLSDI